MRDHDKRRMDWCAATGLKRSRASLETAIGWKYKYTAPSGFDHTEIFYFPKKKIYIVLTEPYAESVFSAAANVMHDLQSLTLSFVACKKGTGIWNPPHCIPVIIAKDEHKDFLVEIARKLPTCAA